ncbi:MAG TPA: hypothetical protein DCE41_11825 [Cytophagales bacterium]|nr:hypothetical protein [Cytophagales bacterium]HAA18106.1 hypothetical protein [Cytophagales bacterium]HAP61883.1 hypothetical protein [Cytophagales bacterium]
MGTLINGPKNEEIILYKRHTIGRAPYLSLVLSGPDISREHGTIFHDGQNWYYQDTSHNGTMVNQKFVNRTTVTLHQGDVIKFGQADTDVWQLAHDHPPTPFLQALEGTQSPIELSRNRLYLRKPYPSVFFFQDDDLRWVVKFEDHAETLKHKCLYTFGGQTWQYYENFTTPPTRSNRVLLDEAQVYFKRQSDTEDWHVTVEARNVFLDLEVHVYHRILAVLAEQMLADQDRGIAPEACGWMSTQELLNQLDPNFDEELDKYYINTQVYRFRKETKQHPFGILIANLLERDKDLLRFNHSKVHFQLVSA